jgi:DNA polymerase-3 subunit alpha (Gram-positive type)
LEYYTAYFSVRADNFSYETMCQGKEALERTMRQMIARSDMLSKKEQDTLKDMRSVQEMYARGFDFIPIDLKMAQANKFAIVDGKIMPALSSIDGLGVKAAESIANAVRAEKLLSIDELKKKAGVGDSVIAMLDQFGILKGMPKSDQISLFE